MNGGDVEEERGFLSLMDTRNITALYKNIYGGNQNFDSYILIKRLFLCSYKNQPFPAK